MAAAAKMPVALEGVPETLLWTLYQRAAEAGRADSVIDDPRAVELVEAIDYPFAERFGGGELGQWQALRARCFDREVRRFQAGHPGGTVVALGEGLETQLWRVDDGRVRWLTVDLPETIAVREQLLPSPPRHRTFAGSALDLAWMDEVDTERDVLITAQGLLMYFERDEVHRLVAACAERFPTGALVFDAVPRWVADLSRRRPLRASGDYTAPPWTWGLDSAGQRALAALPHVGRLAPLRLPRGRGVVAGALLPLASAVPPVSVRMLSVMRAAFTLG